MRNEFKALCVGTPFGGQRQKFRSGVNGLTPTMSPKIWRTLSMNVELPKITDFPKPYCVGLSEGPQRMATCSIISRLWPLSPGSSSTETDGFLAAVIQAKTDTSLADAVIQTTGVIPDSLKDDYPREKIRGPIGVRVVCRISHHHPRFRHPP